MPRKPTRVLVVDDNRDLVETTIAVLRLDGYPAKGCYHGMEALACVKEFNPDAVIVDIGLPGKSGWQVARDIRAEYPGQRPTLIALSGQFTKAADKLLGDIAGFDYYLVKPADPNVLMALLEKAGE